MVAHLQASVGVSYPAGLVKNHTAVRFPVLPFSVCFWGKWINPGAVSSSNTQQINIQPSGGSSAFIATRYGHNYLPTNHVSTSVLLELMKDAFRWLLFH